MIHPARFPYLELLFAGALNLFAGSARAVDAPLPTLTTAAAVKALPREDASRRYPVKLRGVVTFIDNRRYVSFLQDQTGGIYFAPGPFFLNRYVRAQQGDVLEIEGWSSAGRFAPNVQAEPDQAVRYTIVGHEALPEPRRLLPHELVNPVNHSEWVEVTGVVRDVERLAYSVEFQLTTINGEFRAHIPYAEGVQFDPAPWLGAAVRARGVYGSIFNEQRRLTGMELWVQTIDQLTIEDGGAEAFAQMPLRTIAALQQFDPSVGLRARIRGVVTLNTRARGFYLRDPSGSIWVQTPQLLDLAPGTQVDAVGFPSSEEHAPVLRDAVVQPGPPVTLPEPITVRASEALDGKYHSELVRLVARVADRFDHPGSRTLALQSGDILFHATFGAEPQASLKLPPVESWVEVTGICLNRWGIESSAQPNPSTRQATSFQILLRSPQDVSVIKSPPWWTLERAVWVFGGSAIVLLGAIAWAAALRRQVTRQTEIIRAKSVHEAQMEERARIARDLHDTLEQDLAGIQMQLDAAHRHLKSKPDAAERTLSGARALLRHSREEARRTLHDLRSITLESGDLANGMRTLFAALHADDPAKIDVRVTGTPTDLSGPVENHLLRIAQEAVHNALTHGHATRIDVELEFGAKSVNLRVIDNGIGFDPDDTMGEHQGHFGLVGMRERAIKLGTVLKITSEIGEGTRIEIRVTPATLQLTTRLAS